MPLLLEYIEKYYLLFIAIYLRRYFDDCVEWHVDEWDALFRLLKEVAV